MKLLGPYVTAALLAAAVVHLLPAVGVLGAAAVGAVRRRDPGRCAAGADAPPRAAVRAARRLHAACGLVAGAADLGAGDRVAEHRRLRAAGLARGLAAGAAAAGD